jgi:serine protease Do
MRFLAGLAIVSGLIVAGTPVYAQRPESFPPPTTQVSQAPSFLGIGVTDLDADRIRSLNIESESGAEIVRLAEGGPAEKAGLRPGDILLTYNGENILGGRQLGRLVSETPPGRHVKIRYWRNGSVQSCVVVTAQAPDSATMRSEVDDGFRFSMPMDVPTPILLWRNRVLGIIVEPLDPQLADFFGVRDGVLVRYVEKGSPAETGGMKSGDVLTAVGTQAVTNPRDVSSCIRNQSGSKQVTVSLMRNHKPIKLAITPAEYPQ